MAEASETEQDPLLSSCTATGSSREQVLSAPRLAQDATYEDTAEINVQHRLSSPYSIEHGNIRDNVKRYSQLFSADEDTFDQPTTTRKELWSYYLYYNGDNGVGPGSYSQTL